MLWASSYHPAGGRSEASQAQGGHPPPHVTASGAVCADIVSALQSGFPGGGMGPGSTSCQGPVGAGGTPQAVPKERDLQESEEK